MGVGLGGIEPVLRSLSASLLLQRERWGPQITFEQHCSIPHCEEVAGNSYGAGSSAGISLRASLHASETPWQGSCRCVDDAFINQRYKSGLMASIRPRTRFPVLSSC